MRQKQHAQIMLIFDSVSRLTTICLIIFVCSERRGCGQGLNGSRMICEKTCTYLKHSKQIILTHAMHRNYQQRTKKVFE